METNEISAHLFRVYSYVKGSGKWVTSTEVSNHASVAPRTARAHCLRLVQLGIFDQAEVFPSHKYRFSDMAEKRNKAMITRLEKAQEVFAI